jgi:hypothetical protein
MQKLKTIALAMTVLAASLQATSADEAVWRSSKPLRIRVANNSGRAGLAGQSHEIQTDVST